MSHTILFPPHLPLEYLSEQRLEEEAEANAGTTRQTPTRTSSDDVTKPLDREKEDAQSPGFGSSFPEEAKSQGAEAAIPTGNEAATSEGGLKTPRQPSDPVRAIAVKSNASDSGGVGSKQPSLLPCSSRCSDVEDKPVFLPQQNQSLGPPAQLYSGVVKGGDIEQQECLAIVEDDQDKAIVATSGKQTGISKSMGVSVDSLAKFSRFLALLMTSELLVGPITEQEEKALAELIRAR